MQATELAHSPLAPTVDGAIVASDITTVETRLVMTASLGRVWTTLMFYEQIDERPPWYLRWLLPVPLGTEGKKAQVGDEARCLYEGGYLVKRVTQVEREHLYQFEVCEQELAFGGGMSLSGGEYRLRGPIEVKGGGGGIEMSLVTHYRNGRRPRWLFAPPEAAVCHAFHRHILRAMRRLAEA
jgi:hypothetical protein